MPTFDSTHLANAEYDEESSDLYITFTDGSVYRYMDVPRDVYEGLLYAGSAGSYHYQNIRNSFAYERV